MTPAETLICAMTYPSWSMFGLLHLLVSTWQRQQPSHPQHVRIAATSPSLCWTVQFFTLRCTIIWVRPTAFCPPRPSASPVGASFTHGVHLVRLQTIAGLSLSSTSPVSVVFGYPSPNGLAYITHRFPRWQWTISRLSDTAL